MVGVTQMRENELHRRYYSAVNPKPITVIAIAMAFYFLQMRVLIAVALAVIVHELGHIVVLKISGFGINGISCGVQGLCIDYQGDGDLLAHTFSAAAGPIGGLIFAFMAAFAADKTGIAWFNYAAGISLILSAFNLLPFLPLDGGRIVLAFLSSILGESRGTRITQTLSECAAVIVIASGAMLALCGGGIWLLAAGVWLAGCIFT